VSAASNCGAGILSVMDWDLPLAKDLKSLILTPCDVILARRGIFLAWRLSLIGETMGSPNQSYIFNETIHRWLLKLNVNS
jgi:prepilin signal peptidase PulO-like enzyme (type II secretory pathway)